MTKTIKQESALRNPWVWLLIGIMATTLIVNGTLITIAFRSPPSLVVDNYYEKGKEYFYNQAQMDKEAERLGWNLSLDLPKSPQINHGESYLVRAINRDGKPIMGAKAELAAFRPVQNGHDFTLPMHDVGGGYYATDVSFNLPGKWDLIVTVQQGADKLDIAQRVVVAE
jgi:nitrogen fixation protein FixH